MAQRKAKPAPKKRGVKSPAKKLSGSAWRRRSVRDPFAGPTSTRQIERSLNEGTTKTLAQFRADIDWE
jgi:hypothetical protein